MMPLNNDVKLFYDSNLNKVKAFEKEVGIENNKKLKEVAEEFEAIFVNLMLKEMRKSINETGFLKGYREDVFRDLLYWEYSKLIAKNTEFGIAEKIYEIYGTNQKVVDEHKE